MKMRTHILYCFFVLLSYSLCAQPAYWQPTGTGGGGALYNPSISPHDNSEFFLTCDMGELFHSTNLGTEWDFVHFRQLIAGPESNLQYTDDPNILYCLHNNGNTYDPAKSTDGGTTWTILANDPTFSGAYYMFADPNDNQRVLLSSYSNLYFSNDGGSSFSLVYSASDLYLGGVFWDGTNIYVGCRTGLVTSTDNGATFNLQPASGALPAAADGMLSLTGAKQGGTVRLFCVARGNGGMWPLMQPSEFWDTQDVYRLDVGDPTGWQLANTGITPNDYPFLISMPQDDITTVYVAGATEWPNFPTVYKSTDGGNNWTEVFLASGNTNIYTGWEGNGCDENWWYGECAMGFSVASNNPDYAMISDFGFVHLTTDGGATWRQVYIDSADQNAPGDLSNVGQAYHGIGLENTSTWHVHWMNASDIFACYSDMTGRRSTDGGQSWAFDFTGNTYNTTYHMVEHPSNGTLYAATGSTHDMYQTTRLTDALLDGGTGEILYSSDMGVTWNSLHDFSNNVIWLAIDPNNANRMYASVINSGNGGVYVTNDLNNGATSTWTLLPAPPRTEGHPYNIRVLNDGTLVVSFSGRRDGGFTLSSGVFTSTDGGTTWNDVSIPEMHRYTKDVVIDPHDPTQSTWYACVFSHWGAFPNEVGGIYRTTDRGANWVEISDIYRVESCTVNPNNPNEMYVTTENDGLQFTNNLTAANPTFVELSNYPFRQPTRVFFNPNDQDEIWITSFGNGLRKGNINTIIPIKVLLQGPHNGTDMNTDLQTNGLLALSDPYGLGESTSSIPADVVDWLKVEVRDPNNNTIVLATRAAFLRKDGVVLDLDGSLGVRFRNLAVADGYVTVQHRNHLGIMTNGVVSFKP